MRPRKDPALGVYPERTVLPRRRGYVHMALAVAHIGRRVHTDTGEVIDGERWLLCEDGTAVLDIPQYIRHAPPTIFVTLDSSSFLDELQTRFQFDPDWHYTLSRTVNEKDGIGMARVKLRTFGFRGTGHRKQRLHQAWCPRSISPTPLHKLIDGDITHATLLQWASDIRTWAAEQDLELRNAFAGYAAQLLRDPRFYPEPRRRVPRATNERARPSLPGNLVQLYVPAGPREYNVTAIDQRQAHHRIVQQIDIPDGNTLFARGNFNLDEREVWAPRGSELYERTIRQPGLLWVGMHSRVSHKGEFRLPVQEYNGYERRFIWSNTALFIESHGSHIDGIFAAWTSLSADDGLSRYGKWAQSQIETCLPARKHWLKPLLHSTYGLLAARPRPIEIGHRNARGGKSSTFLLGAREFPVKTIHLPDWQPVTTNVIQRGVIEAETQLRSLRMAEELHAAGCRVTHIHTDGLHVEGQLPLLPPDWGVNALTRVMYLDAASWVSKERNCLPGRDEQQRREVIEHIGRLHANLSAQRQAGRFRSRLQRPSKGRNL